MVERMNNSNYKFKFTLFTPCYCSAKFIDRIKETLDKQTFRDFEWIVINDASTDNTSELLQEYIKTVDFPVKFFDLKKNQMLAANYNLAAKNAEGELFVVLGHDDIYLPDMLQNYNDLYEKYNSPEVCGLVGRCITQYGKITPSSQFDKPLMSYWEYGVDSKGNYTGEAPRAIKTDVLLKYMPFDEEEKLNPPIEEMMSCDGYKFITVDKVVRKYFYANSENSLTFSANKYRLHTWKRNLMYINKFRYFMPWPFKRKLKACLEYAYSSVKLGKSLKEALRALEQDKFFVTLMYPAAMILGYVADNKKLHDYIISAMNGHIFPKKKTTSEKGN